MSRGPARAAVALGAAAAGLALLLAGRVPFGLLDDDARHWLAALSLLQGRYADLSLPGAPPLTSLLPGYPILLLPAAALGSLELAAAMSALFLGGAVYLAWRLHREQGAAALWIAALTAFNPLSLVQGATLMSDAPFLFFTLLAALALARAAEEGAGPRRAALLGLLAGGCCWIRPQGAALVLAGTALLAERRPQRTAAAAFAAAAGALAALPFLRNVAAAGTPAGYFSELSGGAGAVLATVASNLAWLPAGAAGEAAAGWVEPWPLSALSWAVGLAASVLLLRGFWLQRGGSAVERFGLLYCAAYLLLQLFWVNRFHRYVFPLLPFLYRAGARALAARPRAAAGAAAATLAVFAWSDAALLAGRTGVMEGALPAAAIARLKAGTGTVAAMSRCRMLAAHTGRPCVPLLSAEDPDRWFMTLLDSGVTEAAVHGWGDLGHYAPARAEAYRAALEAVARRLDDPLRFRKAVEADGWTVYDVLRPEGLEAGWRLLEEARAALDAGDLPRAYQALKRADRAKAPLVRLPFYLGTTALLLGKEPEARAQLREAVRREPGFEAAARNLARLKR